MNSADLITFVIGIYVISDTFTIIVFFKFEREMMDLTHSTRTCAIDNFILPSFSDWKLQ